MGSLITDRLQIAIENLAISDVYTKYIISACDEDFDPKFDDRIESLQVQHMHVVTESSVLELEENESLFRVFIRLGTRWVDPDEEDEDESVRAWIDALYIAEYEMKESIEKECLDEFALKNASFHVWPYWRELLSSTCHRMHLPTVMLPTTQFAQNRDQEVSDEDSSEDPKGS